MTEKRPSIPAEMHKISLLGTLGVIGHALAFLLSGAVVARLAVGTSWPLWLQILVVVPSALVAAQGLHLLGFVGHDGFHFSMHSNKVVSSIIGVLFSSIIPGHLDIGFAISHWNHHKFTNRDGDPDARTFGHFHTFMSRLFLARMRASQSYMLNAVRLALGKPLPFKYKFPLRPEVVQKLAWLNLACSGLFLALYAAIAIYDPLTGLVSIALPTVFVVLLTGLRPYFEHAGTGTGLFDQARTRTSKWATFFLLGNNYHLEHHLYPSVPCYRLGKIHRILVKNDVLKTAHVETTVAGTLAHATSRSQYPDGLSS